MTNIEFISFLNNPSSVKPKHLPQLEEILAMYPYFQGARALVAKASGTSRLIKSASVYSVERSVLRKFVNSDSGDYTPMDLPGIDLQSNDFNAFDALSNENISESDTSSIEEEIQDSVDDFSSESQLEDSNAVIADYVGDSSIENNEEINDLTFSDNAIEEPSFDTDLSDLTETDEPFKTPTEIESTNVNTISDSENDSNEALDEILANIAEMRSVRERAKSEAEIFGDKSEQSLELEQRVVQEESEVINMPEEPEIEGDISENDIDDTVELYIEQHETASTAIETEQSSNTLSEPEDDLGADFFALNSLLGISPQKKKS